MLFHLGIFRIEIKRRKSEEYLEQLLRLNQYEKEYEQSKHDLTINYRIFR